MTDNGTTDADVIIVGGGLMGCVMAGLLARENISSIVIEAREQSTKNTAGDPRALAITPASRHILQAAEFWNAIPADSIGRFREMQVWDEGGSGSIHFAAADLCQPTLGYIIQQDILAQSLHNRLQSVSNVKWYQPATVSALSINHATAGIRLHDSRRLSAKLVIAADGGRSAMRDLAGIEYRRHDYHQTAVACLVETERPHRDTARQRFLSTGPLAFLPLPGPHHCGIVWSTSPEHAAELVAMSEQHFNSALAAAFDYRLGDILSSERRVAYPLQHAQAASYCKPRFALIGDAAHTVHPLAGQGANLGLLDAATLTEVLVSAGNANRDIGLYPVLRRYERWRRGENLIMMKLLQGFKLLFENRSHAVMFARNRGLDIMDVMTPVKNTIMRRAMGLEGDLPVYARQHTACTG
ncbi:MAG TPA: UbiH/UbiF/VisC/COQ6 family ubiquinone biosynthesis hydroxylase [Gammaproteobacteria bacterium]|nr:UbiH/UbiF/VisC/COQ6 family ubiquinone biosynthesis hydroxylase [Gammaproteobacteria bacterium]